MSCFLCGWLSCGRGGPRIPPLHPNQGNCHQRTFFAINAGSTSVKFSALHLPRCRLDLFVASQVEIGRAASMAKGP
jgi:hypothetical protein